MEEQLIKLSIEKAAATFKKSKDSIYYWIKTGKYKSEPGENGKILVLTEQQYESLLPKIEIQSNSINNSNKTFAEIQPKLNQEDLKYIIENLRHFADAALQEKEQRVMLLEDSEKKKENSYLEVQAKLKEVESKNSILEFQLNEAETKLNTIELQFKDKVSLKDNEINALKKQIEEIKINQINPEKYNKLKKDNEALSIQIAELLQKQPQQEKKGFLDLFRR